MPKTMWLSRGALGALFRSERRHQGRHRAVPASAGGSEPSLTGMKAVEPQTPSSFPGTALTSSAREHQQS